MSTIGTAGEQRSAASASPLGARRHTLSLGATFLALFAAAIAWAIALPPGAAPDEPDHFIRAAAVVRGHIAGVEGSQPWLREVVVPQGIADSRAWLCYSGDSYVDASCSPDLPPSQGDAAATTSAGLYNPVYYALVGLPTLVFADPELALYGARSLSALWCTLLLAIGFTYLAAVYGRAFAGTVTLAVVSPMVLFLSSALNPNGLEIAATFSTVAVLVYLARRHGPPPATALVALTASASLLATVRGLGLVWLALAAGVGLAVMTKARLRELVTSPRTIAALCIMGLVAVWSAWWTLSTGTLGAMGQFPGAHETPAPIAFLVMVSRTIAPGLVGHFAWHDVLAPSFTYFAYSIIMGVIVFAALWVGKRRALRAVWVAAAGWFLIPPILQAASVSESGYIWQARYAIPGLVLVIVVAGQVLCDVLLRSRPAEPFIHRALVSIAALGLVAHLGAMQQVQRRFGVSMTGPLDGAYTVPNWTPPGGAAIWMVLLALALGGWLVWVVRSWRHEREIHSDHRGDDLP